jgi:hypothetical protein
MSGYKPIGTELLFATYNAATVSVPTAAAVTITAGWPAIIIPAGYMSNLGDWTSSLKFKMGGFMTAPLATPTLATTPTAGSFSWKMEAEIGLRTMGGPGTTSTLVCHAAIDGGAFAANLQTSPVATGNALITTYDKNINYWLWPYLTLSAATAANTVTAQYGKLYGEN